jgi:23S rRNA (uracil1939-C5)-methyltransferase
MVHKMKESKASHLVSIIDTAYGGSGVGKLENGKTVFIPYTLTGDTAEIEIISEKSSYAEGKLLRIVTPSPRRVEPDCPFFTICGGCHFRHIDYPYQLEIKINILKNLLKLSDIEAISGNPIHYRIRAVFRADRGKVGFYKSSSRELVAFSSCKAVTSSLFDAVSQFAAKPEFSKLNFSLSAIETPAGILAEMKGESLPFLQECAPFKGAKLHRVDKPAKDKGGVIGAEVLPYPLKYGAVPVTFGSFFQANRHLLETFQDTATEKAEGRILELYAGSGFFTSALMSKGSVQGAEADKNAAALGKKYHFPIKKGDALTVLKNTSSGSVDTLFLDPPRVGVGKGVISEIIRITPRRIIYVSCDPMTLARDVIPLKERWMISRAYLMDMFPHTYHMESVAILELEG